MHSTYVVCFERMIDCTHVHCDLFSSFTVFLTFVAGLYVCVDPKRQFFSHVGTFSWVEPVLSRKIKLSCSRTQHSASGEVRTSDPSISREL